MMRTPNFWQKKCQGGDDAMRDQSGKTCELNIYVAVQNPLRVRRPNFDTHEYESGIGA